VNEASRTTFLVVTHDPRLANRCDRIIELVDGRVVDDRLNPHPDHGYRRVGVPRATESERVAPDGA
jgi:ABC-type lipoprotein export system ATPase subunit